MDQLFKLECKVIDIILSSAMKTIFQASRSHDEFQAEMADLEEGVEESLTNEKLVSQLTVNASGFVVTIGVFWSPYNMKLLISEGIRRDLSDVNMDVAIGFMGELCNGIAGGIKAEMVKFGINMTLGLPEYEEAFDANKHQWDFIWNMYVQEGGVIFFAKVDPWESDQLKTLLEKKSEEKSDDDDDIEFL